MFSVDLSTREGDGDVIVALRGELDVLDAADVAGALAAVTAGEPRVIVDLAGLGFIDASGLAALVSGRKHVGTPGGDLLLAAPQQRVLQVLTVTHLLDLFSVHPSVEEAVRSAGSWRGWPRRWPVLSSLPPHDSGRVLHRGVARRPSPVAHQNFRRPPPRGKRESVAGGGRA
jgi:anti-sigma B factor antagonist